MTREIDGQGFYVLDKHVTVTITLDAVSYLALSDFNLPGIIFDLEVTNADAGFQLAWSGSFGVEGTIRAQQMRIDIDQWATYPRTLQVYFNPIAGAIGKEFATVGLKDITFRGAHSPSPKA